MSRVVHFEIQADDCDRAREFYAAVFGWEFQDWGPTVGTPYWIIVTGTDEEPGINGGLLERPAPLPAGASGTNAFTCIMQVDDYDATHEKVLAAGGSVAQPKTALPAMAWQGYYVDTEGNTFGVYQDDPEAA